MITFCLHVLRVVNNAHLLTPLLVLQATPLLHYHFLEQVHQQYTSTRLPPPPAPTLVSLLALAGPNYWPPV